MEQNSLNLKDFHTNRIKEIKKEKEYNEIEWFSNNYELKVSLVNIDSRFRNKIPKNIIDTNPIFLTTDPLSLASSPVWPLAPPIPNRGAVVPVDF